MKKRIIWILFAFCAISIGIYPVIYFLIDRKFALLASKTNELLADISWNVGFYTHIILGGLALLIGWIQFSEKFRNKNLNLHRQIGKLYVISALLSAISGIYIGFYATGGLVSVLGFVSLGIIWFYVSLNAYLKAKNKEIFEHQKMMIYSYAACFAAVTLRIWLPILTIILGDFMLAYPMVAWLCWIPNLMVAYLLVRKLELQKI